MSDGPRTWATEELVALRSARTLPSAYSDREPFEWHLHGLPEVVAVGRRRDGRWVSFERDASKPRWTSLPSTGRHGAIVDLQLGVAYRRGGWCGNGWTLSGEWVARTDDGALLASDGGRPWREVIPPGPAVRDVALYHDTWCAIVGDEEVRCGSASRVASPTSLPALRQPGQVEVAIAPSMDVACTRNRVGRVRCAGIHSGKPLELSGLPSGVVAMALGPSDVCVEQGGGTWWCARGPGDDASLVAGRSRRVALRPIARLAGAIEVALTDGGGCGWRRDGAVSCWGITTPMAGARAW